MIIEKSGILKKTHSVNDLKLLLGELNISISLCDDELELIDSIYLPSKYPIGNALPDSFPDLDVCKKSIVLLENVRDFVLGFLNKN